MVFNLKEKPNIIIANLVASAPATLATPFGNHASESFVVRMFADDDRDRSARPKAIRF